MTVQELVKLSSQKVRRDSDLMAFYIESFKAQFGKAPNCAGCTFSTDFIKLKSAVEKGTTKTSLTMEKKEKTFVLNKGIPDILTYKRNGKNIRKYAKQIDELFALEYLTIGTKSEISERRKQFRILPAEIIAKDEKKADKKPKEEKFEVSLEVEPIEVEETIEEVVIEQPKETKKPKSKGRPKKK